MLNFKIVISEFVKSRYHAITFLLSDLQFFFEGVKISLITALNSNSLPVSLLFSSAATGADEQELGTPILSLCHGIFTD